MNTDNCTGCGHTFGNHDGSMWPQCSAARCTCLRYRAPAGAAPALKVVPAPPILAPPIPASLSTPALRRVDTPPPAPSAPQPGLSIDNLAQACLRSESKRTQALGPKLLALGEKARAALRDEREAAEAKVRQAEEAVAVKAKVEKLTKQLAAAKAELRKVKPAGGGGLVGDGSAFQCEECDAKFASPQGRGAHAFRAHGRRKAAT